MTPPSRPSPARPGLAGPVMVLAGGTALGFAPIGLRLGLEDLGPQAIAFWRYFLAVPILFALVMLVERRLPRRPDTTIFLAGTFFTLDMALWHWSLTLTSVSNATFIVNLGNIGLGLIAWVLMRERPSANWFAAALLAIIGAAALSLGKGQLEQGAFSGDLLALLAALFVALYMMFSKLARKGLSGLEVIFWLSLVEACLALPVTVLAGERLLPASPDGLLMPLALAVFVQILGQGLIVSGLGSTNTAVAGILVLAQPVVAAFVAWQIFAEPLTAVQMGGAGLILFAVWLARLERAPQPAGAHGS